MDSYLSEHLLIREYPPLEEISIQDVEGVPYFVIPKYYSGPSEPNRGKNYQEEYFNSLEEHYQLTQTLQDLLYERGKLLEAIGKGEQPSPVVKENKKVYNRSRRPAGQIARHFKCSICTKAYGNEGSLRHHVKLKHGSPNN